MGMKVHTYCNLLLKISIGSFIAENLPKLFAAKLSAAKSCAVGSNETNFKLEDFINKTLKYLTAQESISLHFEMIDYYTFTIEQIVELNGLSVAGAIYKVYNSLRRKNVLIISGPANNGAEGLVCARHLVLYGFNVTVHYPRRSQRTSFRNLYKQCTTAGVATITDLPSKENINSDYDLIVDAVFGFTNERPFRTVFEDIIILLSETTVPICSIDIPSGWDLEEGPIPDVPKVQPELLISLKAPKRGATHFKGKYHYIGGRYLPPDAEHGYFLYLPPYPGTDCVVQVK